MRPVTLRARGFTMLEALVVLVIVSVLLGVGLPSMRQWIARTRAGSAAEFYAEGFRLARQEALNRNAHSRVTLTENANNGQYDWQVDVCYATTAAPCNDTTGAWSTTAAAAGNDPEGVHGFHSVFRVADSLPATAVLQVVRTPTAATDVYFLPTGWLDMTVTEPLVRVDVRQANGGHDFPPTSLVLSLAGMLSKCDPSLPSSDSRACPTP